MVSVEGSALPATEVEIFVILGRTVDGVVQGEVLTRKGLGEDELSE